MAEWMEQQRFLVGRQQSPPASHALRARLPLNHGQATRHSCSMSSAGHSKESTARH
jgi:hypothetical protein